MYTGSMPSLKLDTVHLGDCLIVLRDIPNASLDAIVTDPPYGLGNREPRPEDIARYLRGESLDTGGDFMGKPWEIPTISVWKECFRVLKPGGHILVFAGTRTWDLMSLGLRMAGFENRDTIASEFGMSVLQFVHGQGFPKSLNISKAIDKMAGAEREVIGVKPGHEEFVNRTDAHAAGGDSEAWERPWKNDPERVAASHMQTAPATEDAKRWGGWGTALKPSWEPILVYRKPLEESTVARQVLATGTGGLNIDATRVRHSNAADFERHKAMVDRLKEQGGSLGNSWKNSSDLSGASDVKTEGRWPSNLVLCHHPDCKRVGTAEAPAPVINRFDDGMKPFGDGAGHPYTSSGGGTEEVAVYECAEGCPVRMLDEQSGELKNGGSNAGHVRSTPGQTVFGKDMRGMVGTNFAGDAGGASRFFPSFEGQAPPAAPFLYTSKASKRETTLDGQVENNHPTKKPLALMEWLVKLVCPKGGTVLDPYCGSGTTCVAATANDMHFIGIERDEKYHAIAVRRAGIVHAEQERERGQKSIFDHMAEVADALGDDEDIYADLHKPG